MAFDLEAEQQKQSDLYDEIVNLFNTAKLAFDETATDPGSGFDIEQWLALLPTPTLRSATITDITDPTSYHANDLTPIVTPPVLITPAQIALLAEQGYDSAYLEEIEQEIRVLTADTVAAVMPVGTYDNYFRVGNIKRARATRDTIDDIKEQQGGRGFYSPPMSMGRMVGEELGKWQDQNYKVQNDASEDRLKKTMEVYFSSINNGIKIEDIRSRVIMEYARLYSNHNKVLAGYYDLFVTEKVAAAKLLLDNVLAALTQETVNVGIINKDNKEEVELPETIYRRALTRLKNEFLVDDELTRRRQDSMKYICDVYSGWMTAAVGGIQSTLTAKHDTTAV